MTKIEDILSVNYISINCKIASKKRALELLSEMIAEDSTTITSAEIFAGFTAREKLGSTIITPGIAIPHTRLASVKLPIGAFIRLDQQVNYDCHDQKNVDILFGLVMPSNDKQQHISVLSCLAECFNSPQRIEKVRNANSVDEVFDLLTECKADVNLE